MKCIGRFGKWILIASSAAFLLTGCARIGQQFKAQEVVRAYEAEHYNKNLYTGELFASDLCVDVYKRQPLTWQSSIWCAIAMTS